MEDNCFAEAPVLWPPDKKNRLFWKRLWCWERLRAGKGGDREWDCWLASLTQWTWVWANSGRERRTGKLGVTMDSQRVGHDLAIEQQIALQCCVGFCCTTTWISLKYTHISPRSGTCLPYPHLTSLGCYRALDWAPCVTQQLPTSYLFHTRWCTCFNATLSIQPTFSFPHRQQVIFRSFLETAVNVHLFPFVHIPVCNDC